MCVCNPVISPTCSVCRVFAKGFKGWMKLREVSHKDVEISVCSPDTQARLEAEFSFSLTLKKNLSRKKRNWTLVCHLDNFCLIDRFQVIYVPWNIKQQKEGLVQRNTIRKVPHTIRKHSCQPCVVHFHANILNMAHPLNKPEQNKQCQSRVEALDKSGEHVYLKKHSCDIITSSPLTAGSYWVCADLLNHWQPFVREDLSLFYPSLSFYSASWIRCGIMCACT